MSMDRRRFLTSVPAGVLALSAAPRTLAALALHHAGPAPITFRINAASKGEVIPANVMGVSYESTQLGEPAYFSAENHGLIQLFRTLSPSGSLRLGGDTSEFTYFKPNDKVQAPPFAPQPKQPTALTPITPQALRNLRAFLDATGWNCIYGLNFGTGTPQRAAEEAVAVTDILGPKLEYLQIGNEANNYIRYKLRGADWDEKQYVAQWLQFACAIVAKLPNAKLGGPDMGAFKAVWFNHFVEKGMAEFGRNIVAITDHFYAEGPPTAPESTMETLLLKPKKIDEELANVLPAMHKAGVPARMTEINSCYSGGKPGVSDTLGAAIWAADLTLKLVTNGYCGINFHGGSAKHIRASLDGTLPGDLVSGHAADDSYYTPIAGNSSAGYTARPIFYGMMLAARMAGSTLVGGAFDAPADTVTGYATLSADGKTLQIALFNKQDGPAEITLDAGQPVHAATALRLGGASLTATSGITLGHAGVAADGSWTPATAEKLHAHAGTVRVSLPAAGGALVTLKLV